MAHGTVVAAQKGQATLGLAASHEAGRAVYAPLLEVRRGLGRALRLGLRVIGH